MRAPRPNCDLIAARVLSTLLAAAAWPAAVAQVSQAQQPQDGDLHISIRLPEGRVYAGVPLLVCVQIANPGETDVKVSQFARGRGTCLKIVAGDQEGRKYPSSAPGGQLDFWDDLYHIPATIPGRTTYGSLDMLLLPATGEYALEASFVTPEGGNWAAQPVAVTVRPVPADDPFFGVVYELGLVARPVVSQVVQWFNLHYNYPPSKLQLWQVADRLFVVCRPQPPYGAYAGGSVFLESIAAVDILTSSRPALFHEEPRLPVSDLVYRCAWFESRFPRSFLLPEVRYRKALLLAAEGQQDEAKALLRKERERSPIARLLYHNLASMSADAARLLREEE